MTLIADVFPKLPSPKKVIRLMSVKSRLKGLFHKKHGKRAQNLEIRITLPLPYLFIPVNIIQLERAYLSAVESLKTVCLHIDQQ